MGKHTPGPWDFICVDSGLGNGEKHIAVFSDCEGDDDKEGDDRANGGCNICCLFGPDEFANARLIMVAPEILLALECLVDSCPPVDRKGKVAHKKAIALIAMARGEDDA